MSSPVRPRVYEFTSGSAEGTIEVGRGMAELLRPPQLLILRGELGAGKTTLVKGIAEALGVAQADEVTSPTFTLIREYAGALTRLYHLDLYRIEEERELAALGLDDLWGPDTLTLVEWGEKFPRVAERATGEIALLVTGDETRRITLTLEGQTLQ